jgi:hypothetical protein
VCKGVCDCVLASVYVCLCFHVYMLVSVYFCVCIGVSPLLSTYEYVSESQSRYICVIVCAYSVECVFLCV